MTSDKYSVYRLRKCSHKPRASVPSAKHVAASSACHTSTPAQTELTATMKNVKSSKNKIVNPKERPHNLSTSLKNKHCQSIGATLKSSIQPDQAAKDLRKDKVKKHVSSNEAASYTPLIVTAAPSMQSALSSSVTPVPVDTCRDSGKAVKNDAPAEMQTHENRTQSAAAAGATISNVALPIIATCVLYPVVSDIAPAPTYTTPVQHQLPLNLRNSSLDVPVSDECSSAARHNPPPTQDSKSKSVCVADHAAPPPNDLSYSVNVSRTTSGGHCTDKNSDTDHTFSPSMQGSVRVPHHCYDDASVDSSSLRPEQEQTMWFPGRTLRVTYVSWNMRRCKINMKQIRDHCILPNAHLIVVATQENGPYLGSNAWQKRWERAVTAECLKGKFTLVGKDHLWATHIAVYARTRDVLQYVNHVHHSEVPVGSLGFGAFMGNKGGVAVALTVSMRMPITRGTTCNPCNVSCSKSSAAAENKDTSDISGNIDASRGATKFLSATTRAEVEIAPTCLDLTVRKPGDRCFLDVSATKQGETSCNDTLCDSAQINAVSVTVPEGPEVEEHNDKHTATHVRDAEKSARPPISNPFSPRTAGDADTPAMTTANINVPQTGDSCARCDNSVPLSHNVPRHTARDECVNEENKDSGRLADSKEYVTFLFINAHLPASQQGIKRRNRSYKRIVCGLRVGMNGLHRDLFECILRLSLKGDVSDAKASSEGGVTNDVGTATTHCYTKNDTQHNVCGAYLSGLWRRIYRARIANKSDEKLSSQPDHPDDTGRCKPMCNNKAARYAKVSSITDVLSTNRITPMDVDALVSHPFVPSLGYSMFSKTRSHGKRNAVLSQRERNSYVVSKDVTEQFDFTIFGGDLNYRINARRSAIESNVQLHPRMRDGLLKNDQLVLERSKNAVFHRFKEGKMTFLPTYKYKVSSESATTEDAYFYSDKSKQSPAYCDRILYKKRLRSNIHCVAIRIYTDVPQIQASDHRPVVCIYELETKACSSPKISG